MTPRRCGFPLLLALPLVLSLAACAPEPEPSATPTAAPVPSASPTPEAPVVAFDGDCAKVLGDADLRAAMGEAMRFWEPAWTESSDSQLGGVTCSWTSDEYLAAFATVWAYPVEVIDAEYVTGDASNSCDADESRCTASAVFGDVWVGVNVYSDTAASQIEALRPVLADIGARAEDAPTPIPGAREGWWSPVPTCEDLASALSEDGIDAVSSEDRGSGWIDFAGGPLTRGCTLRTTIGHQSSDALVVLRAGAGEGVDAVIAQTPEARIDHAGRTFAAASEQFPIDGNPGLLLGSDGVNLIELMRRDWDGATQTDALFLDAMLTALAG